MSACSERLPRSVNLPDPVKLDNPLQNPFSADPGFFRWPLAAAMVLLVHAALIFWLLYHRESFAPPGVPLPAILVDLEPMSASPLAEAQPEIAPAMQQAVPEETKPEAQPEPVKEPSPDPAVIPIEPMPSVPLNERAVAVMQPPPKPAPAHPAPPKHFHKESLKQEKKPPAPRTSAPAPSASVSAQPASQTATGSMGAAAADARAAWYARLVGQLKRNQRYPEAARAKGEQGVAQLSFTVDRSGRILSAQVSRSSGSAELDAETVAMARRSSPLPAPPVELAGSQFPFTLPIRFSVR